MDMRNLPKDVLDIVIAFVVAWVFYQGLAFALDTPMPIVSVVSNSMEPILHRGDLLIVRGFGEYNTGDIAIYQRPDIAFTIVHRIIEKKDNKFVFRGDNNPAPDRVAVMQEQIMGKVLFAVPLLGYPRLALYAIGI